jgi:hypothetical protein
VKTDKRGEEMRIGEEIMKENRKITVEDESVYVGEMRGVT